MHVPRIDIEQIRERIKVYADPFQYNPHGGYLGPSRTGKSYYIRHAHLPVYHKGRIVVIDVKPGGARTWNEWGNDVTELKPGFFRGPDGTANYRLMLQRGEAGKTQVARFLDFIKEEGSCVIVIDDSRQITSKTPGLGLSDHIDELLTIGAEIGITAILAANSNVWAASTLRDQCGMYWIGSTRSATAQKEFIGYAGLPRKEVTPYLNSLHNYEFLYSDKYSGELTFAITNYTS